MLRVLDLFSGIGGFSLGLERTGGFKTVAFCEIDPFCRRVLAKHWPEVPCYDDIRTLTAERLRADGIAADVLCGGFPCQDISVAGKGAGIDGKRSGLWAEYARLIGELRPVFVIIENVPALRTRGADRVLSDLEALGYAGEPVVVGSIHAGAPHRRQRAWIVAHAHGGGWREQGHVSEAEGRRSEARHSLRCGSGLANANSAGLAFGQGICGDDGAERSAAIGGSWRRSEPDVGRVVDGPAARLDRRKRLIAIGNAVDPDIPELIGRAILASQQREAA